MRTAPLGEVADIERSSVRPDEIGEGEIYVGLEHITGDGELVGVERVSAGDLRSTKFRFDERHVLYGKLRPYLAKIAAPEFGGVCSTDILPIRPGPEIDRGYLLHFLRTPKMVSEATKLATGANLPRLSPKALAEFSIPLPPIGEQRRTAAILDAANAIRAKRRKALAKLDAINQAVYIDMFVARADPAWTAMPVSELADDTPGAIRTGPFGSQLLHEEFSEEGPVAVLGIDNAVQNRFAWGERRFIADDKYQQLKRYTVRPGDVLVTIMGTCGRVAIVPDDIPLAINTKHLCCITLDWSRCRPEYLWASLRFHPDVLRQLGATRGAVMPGLNMGLIKQAELPVPPLELQDQFAQRKRRAEQQLALAERHAAQLDTLFLSLQQRAFRGDL